MIQTIFGTFDEKQLKTLKGCIDEMIVVQEKMDSNKNEMKAILGATYDELKIPKKILRKMVRVQHKQNFQNEVAESKEFETLFEEVSKI